MNSVHLLNFSLEDIWLTIVMISQK